MIVHDVKQGSFEWRVVRLGKVTGGRLKRVFAADNIALVDELIAEQLTETWEDDDYVNEAMQRGIDLEPEALNLYESIYKIKLHRDGFVQCDQFPMLGYSPDGRLGDLGGVEIKCPSSKKHIQYLRQNKLPNDYKWQVLSSFIINPKIQWYDFMSYDPRVQQRPYFIHRTFREDVLEDLNKAVVELGKFFAKLQEYKEEILFPEAELKIG